MTSPLFNQRTADSIQKLIESAPHAVLLEGVMGVGLLTAALHIAGKELISTVRPINAKGEIDPAGGSIKIAQIRELYDSTKGKAISERYVIIDDADKMGIPAQNAFLKLLEEPSSRTHFILTTHHPERLLPTIMSRVQRSRIDPISRAETNELIATLNITDEKKKSQLLYVAEGLPAEISRLAKDQATFETKVRFMTDARVLLQGETLEKMKVLNAYHAKRSDALALIEAVETILARTIAARPSADAIALADSYADAYEHIKANGNVKLQLLSVVL